MNRFSLLVLSVAVAASAATAQADETNGFGEFTLTSTKEPIEVTSEKLEFDYKQRRAIFRGGVEVFQGDIQLASDLLTVVYADVGKEQQLREVIAEGSVRIVQGARKATGRRAVFDQSTRTLVLTGEAVLEEGANQISGDTIVVYPDESRMEVKGENRRVKVFLFPKKETSGGSKPPEERARGEGEGAAGPGHDEPPG